MPDKLVHVNAYVKDDGTNVREHYRGGGMTTSIFEGGCEVDTDNSPNPLGDCTNSEETIRQLEIWLESDGILKNLPRFDKEMTANMVLKGSASKTDMAIGGGDILEALQVMMLLVRVGGKLALEGIKIASSIKYAIKHFDKIGEAQMIPQMEGAVQLMRQNQSNSVQLETQTLERLTNSRTQREYKKLYDTYVKQRELNRKTEDVLNRIEYLFNNKNYEALIDELKNYQTIQQEGMKEVNDEYLSNMLNPTIPSAEDMPMPQSLTPANPIDWKELRRTGLHDYPEVQKQIIGAGMNIAELAAPDANRFWKIATDDVKGYREYVDKNGSFVESISQLPFDFKETIRAKVQEQLHVDDAKGLILRPESGLSKEIAQSGKFQDFVKTHLSELLRGEIVSGSACFDSSNNLYLTLKNANIIDTYINKNGDIVSFVLDTYDFNPKEQWYIEWAHNVQEKGLLTGFYSLIIIVVPKDEWLKWYLGL